MQVDEFRCEDINECYTGELINSIAFSRFRHNEEEGHPKLCQGENVLALFWCWGDRIGSYQ